MALNDMLVKVKRLAANAVIPTKAHETDAGFDLYATSVDTDDYGNITYGTGLAFEIPRGFVGLLYPRSSNARKDLALTNSVGVIDSGYRGEVTMKFKRFRSVSTEWPEADYKIGDRIGQLIIMPYPGITFVESPTLSASDRGEGGYGSSGR